MPRWRVDYLGKKGSHLGTVDVVMCWATSVSRRYAARAWFGAITSNDIPKPYKIISPLFGPVQFDGC
jgi:hypothetical protein